VDSSVLLASDYSSLILPMPPQPGVFPLPYASTSTHKSRANHTEIHNGTTDMVTSYPPPPHHTVHHPSSSNLLAGPSSRPHGTFLLHLRHVLIHSFVASPGTNTDDGKKDRRRKEIVGRLGKEMNDRRDECVSPHCFLFVQQHSNKVGFASLVGANTPNRSLPFTAWPCNSPHVQKLFRHIRFAYTPSPSNVQRCSRSWRWKNGTLLRAQRRPMSWSANASRRNGSAVGTGYESGFLRASRSGGGEREMKRMGRELSVVRGLFFTFLFEGHIVEAFLQRPPSIPSRVHTSRVNFVTDSAHHLHQHLSHHTPTVSQTAWVLHLQDQSQTRTRSPSMSFRHPSHCHLPQHRYLT
jgi:hypothetical protein